MKIYVKKDEEKGRHQKIILFSVVLLILIYLMWCAPLCSDDYEFLGLKLKGFKSIMHYALYYGNGRLLGNFGVVYLVKYKILRVIIRAVAIASICMLLPDILGCRDIKSYLLSNILIVGVCPALFGEVFTWTSGFQNYIPPIWFTLVILWMIKKCNNQEDINNIWKKFVMIIIFVLGIASQLYVEHSTIVNTILSISLLLFCRRKKLKLASILSMIWMISTGIGIVLMIIIPKLFYKKENRVTGYRKLNMEQISSIINSCKVNSGIMAKNIEKNVLIFIVLISVGCLLIYLHKRSLKKKIFGIILFLQIIPMIYIIISNLYINSLALSGHLIGFKIILDDSAFAAVIVGVVLILYNLNLKKLLYLNIYISSIMVLSMAPLLVVDPLPARVMFQSYIFLVAIILVDFEYIIINIHTNVKKWISIMLKIIFSVLMLMLVFIFKDIKKIDDNRTKYIQEQMKVNAKIIEIYRIPYKYVFWDGEWMFNRYYCYDKYGDIKIRENKKANRKFPDFL